MQRMRGLSILVSMWYFIVRSGRGLREGIVQWFDGLSDDFACSSNRGIGVGPVMISCGYM